MARWALYEPPGRVAQLETGDAPPFEVAPPLRWIEVPEALAVTTEWTYDGATFRPPAPQPLGLPDSPDAHPWVLAAVRYLAKRAGLVLTDAEIRAGLLAERAAREDPR